MQNNQMSCFFKHDVITRED